MTLAGFEPMTMGKPVRPLAHSAMRAVISFQLLTYIVIYFNIYIYTGGGAFKSIAILLKCAITRGGK